MTPKKNDLQDFTVQGKLIETINLTDSFEKVKKIVNHEDRHNLQYLNAFNQFVSEHAFFRIKDTEYPIRVISVKRVEIIESDFLRDI
jgi:hypothetical protein